MMRSLSFVIDETVTTQVCVTGNLDGTLSFEFTVFGAGNAATLEAVFIDLIRPLPGGGLRVYGDAGLSLGPCVAEGTDTLGRAATLARPAVDARGGFDIGIAFGPCDPAAPAARRTGFTLAHDTAVLSLDLFDLAGIGLRYRQPTAVEILARAAGDPGDVVQVWPDQEVLEVIEFRAVGTRPLAGNPGAGNLGGGALAVLDLAGTQDVFAELAREQGWWGVDGPQPFYDGLSPAFSPDR
ncbi:MAG: hypothetical protein KDK53_16650 [Maritimibacter sp.]|nr:hypothetical protein [Maritimibacter sp.]